MGPPMQRMAVIDMGSNSFRLVVFEYEPTGWWSLIDEIREPTRVSAGMGESGALQPKPMKRAVQTAIVFSNFLRASGVERVEAVATSAIRDASNRDELLAEITERTGLEVRVISGAEEAWYGYLAIANSTTVGDGFGIDIGGGSVQIMQLQGRRLLEAESVRLGAVRVSEEFLPDEEATAKQIKALRKHVARTLSEFEWFSGGEQARLAGLGGTIRNLAAAAQKRLEVTDLDVQGFVLTREALGELIEELASRPGGQARVGARHQARPRRRDPGRRGGAGRGDGAGRLHRDRGDRGRPARGRAVRAHARGPRAAADGRRPARVGREPGAPLPRRPRARRARGQAVAGDVRRARPRRTCTTWAATSARCCGRPACCTTSACRSTTTTTTATRTT